MEFEPLTIRYGINFKTVLFPLTLFEFANSLEKRGYEISPNLPFPRPAGRLTGVGEIARKGKTVIQIDGGAQALNVIDLSVQSALEHFEEIVKMLVEDHNIDINKFARFYSFTATYEFPTKRQSYEAIAKALKFSIFDDLEKIMGKKIWPFELRFGGANLLVNSENWFDITVRPNVERDDSYLLDVVFRNTDRVKTREFMVSFEEKMVKVIELIER